MGATRFDLKKPFDIAACRREKIIAIECKQLKSYQAFGRRHMRDHQVDALHEIRDRGGVAWVLLNVRQKKPYLNRLIPLRWGEDQELFTPGSSIKKSDLMRRGYCVGKDGRFPLSFLA
jgi:penicillin-binding protein-related factor A (putative recombinase)